jgi:photosystem II stability/assembly factor-like uncharacterized protein
MKHSTLHLFLFLFVVFNANTINAQWIQSNAPTGTIIWGMAANDTNLYAAVWTQGVYCSNDYGLTWAGKNNGLASLLVKCFEITDSYVFEAGWGVSRSSDQGANWTEVNNGLTSLYTFSLAHTDMYTYVGSLGGLVFYSANNGDLWNPIPIGATNNSINELAVIDAMLFAGTDGSGIFRTSDNGANWEPVSNGLANLQILSLEVSGSTLYAGTYWDGFFISTDYGANWINSTNNLPVAPDNTINAIAFDGSTIFVGLNHNGVYVSQDNGASWLGINEGFIYPWIRSLAVSGPNLVAGTFDNGIWWRPLTEIYNFLDIPPKDMAREFALGQNYPNPVKSTTLIPINLPNNANVSIKVFDKTGRMLAIIAEGYFTQGKHKVSFDGSFLPNGIYYYTLTSGIYTQTRSLAVIR